jgi:hypothetical protein
MNTGYIKMKHKLNLLLFLILLLQFLLLLLFSIHKLNNYLWLNTRSGHGRGAVIKFGKLSLIISAQQWMVHVKSILTNEKTKDKIGSWTVPVPVKEPYCHKTRMQIWINLIPKILPTMASIGIGLGVFFDTHIYYYL